MVLRMTDDLMGKLCDPVSLDAHSKKDLRAKKLALQQSMKDARHYARICLNAPDAWSAAYMDTRPTYNLAALRHMDGNAILLQEIGPCTDRICSTIRVDRASMTRVLGGTLLAQESIKKSFNIASDPDLQQAKVLSPSSDPYYVLYQHMPYVHMRSVNGMAYAMSVVAPQKLESSHEDFIHHTIMTRDEKTDFLERFKKFF